MKSPMVIVRDTREQDNCAWSFSDGCDPAPVLEWGTLTTGDYSIKGFEDVAAIERKEFQDFIGCLGANRARFEREMSRAQAFRDRRGFFAVVIEGPLSRLRNHDYRGDLDPNAGEQTVLAFIQRYGIPFVFCNDRRDAEITAFHLLRHHAVDFWRKSKAIERAIKAGSAAK